MVSQPLHTIICKAIPLRRPSWDTRFVRHILVKLLTSEVTTFTYDETAIIWAARLEVDKALKTAETGLCWILVLVWPWRISGEIGAIVEADVDGVEGNNEIICSVDLLESLYDARFLTDLPHEIFM